MKSLKERELARNATFERDHHRCVFCGGPATDAHHILERRLWADGGYHLDNLVSVCESCHAACESGVYLPSQCRLVAGIGTVHVPDHMYDDVPYDKWGNVLLDQYTLSRGPLVDESLEKFLTYNGWTFKDYTKYPRTFHLPWSNPNRDDKMLSDLNSLNGKEVVVTEKLDGENITLYNDFLHARSISGKSHPSQSWIRNYHAGMKHNIPAGMRIVGEYVYAQHSIHYDDLETYFYGISVWDGMKCLSWDETLEWFALLDITPVQALAEGTFSKAFFAPIHKTLRDDQEGYVVRLKDSFQYRDFSRFVAKYVRPNHLQTPERWDGQFRKNELRK